MSATTSLPHADQHVALIGLGAIGISFLALHLQHTAATVSVYDPRPDLQEHVANILPLYLNTGDTPSRQAGEDADPPPSEKTGRDDKNSVVSSYIASKRLRFCAALKDAVEHATIVQEQGPENLAFKQSTWTEILRHTSPTTHLWSSTSGIPASQQLSHLSTSSEQSSQGGGEDDGSLRLSAELITSARERLLVVHPFNPPHIMPILELVPSPSTSPSSLSFARTYFSTASPLHRPIPIRKETKGFIANRLSFILFREACSLVNQGVASVAEIDEVMRSSLGVRWAVGGVFEMYNYGGGNKGMEGFIENIGGALGEVWRDDDRAEEEERRVRMQGEGSQGWKGMVVEQTKEAYGMPGAGSVRWRDDALRKVVEVQGEIERTKKDLGNRGS